MFLRRYPRRKNGKTHSYWALVESYRTGRGSRPRGGAQRGRNLAGRKRPQRSLFDPPHYDDPLDEEEPVLVRLKDVALERLRDFGDVRLAWGLWRLVGLDQPV